MPQIVLLATAWGPKYGGINSFNMDFAEALGALLRPIHVTCVVLAADAADIENAKRRQVSLLSIGASPDHDHFEPSRAHDVIAAVRVAMPDEPVLWWIGHDLTTGEAAVALPAAAGQGKSAVIHHMSYLDYFSYKHGVAETARAKHERQTKLFRAADKVLGVGPLLRNTLADMLERAPADVPMLIPGLAQLDPGHAPSTFTAITFGRLDPENDRIKQGRLAVSAFGAAYRQAFADGRTPSLTQQRPRLKVIGIRSPDEEDTIRRLAQEKADAALNVLALQYDDQRENVFTELRTSSIAMMLSWHEGFGLTGWEAIAAEVPLIVSRQSGLFRLLSELDAGAYANLV